ncbi:MAG: hypothetical protein HS116_13980 [Planctomycetes bacterium]|nr:hypothetical protein [Planctomycetota bacterium]
MDEGDEIEIKNGGGCLMLFGLPFLGMGLMFTYAALTGQVKNSGGGPSPVWFAVPFGLIFASIGAGFVFGRSGVILNRSSRTAAKWWGLLVPFSRTEISVGDGAWVHINREIRKTKNSSYTVFPVRVVAGAEKITWKEPRVYEEARSEAERVAKFLDLGVRDVSAGNEIVREKGTLDENMRQRLKREGVVLEMPTKPEGCRVSERVEGDAAIFDLPVPPQGGAIVLSIIFVTVFVGIFAFVFGGGILGAMGVGSPAAIVAVGLLATLLGAGFVARAMIHASVKAERLTVSTRGLVLERETGKGWDRKELSSDELEELSNSFIGTQQLSGGRGALIARSDRLNLEFGQGLNHDERAWLCDVIRYLVTAPPR